MPTSYYGFGGYGFGPYGTGPVRYVAAGYYLNLITSEYKNSPKFVAFLSAVIKMLEDASFCIDSMTGAFDIDLAFGAQLDVLGQIVGVSRIVNFQPSGGASPILDDTTYRILLKATIANNQWDGTIGSLYPIWKQLFPSGNIVIIDNQNMTATLIMTGAFSSILKDLISNGYIIPRPQAVLYTYDFGSLPLFGFDRDDSFIAGFDTGKWA